MSKKVRCENCDAVIDGVGDYCGPELADLGWWSKPIRCYHCNSYRVRDTDEPYRLPKWERMRLPPSSAFGEADK